MNGSYDDIDEQDDIDTIKDFIIPKLLNKKIAVLSTAPDGREILHNVKPRVEITRKFCPDVTRTSSYPDLANCSEESKVELQLKKQRIVNTELKRLLIASVGDALAKRLEKLADEKAHLSETVAHLTNRTTNDTERIENLTITGDIWKSKFLAARVVVNELNSWKDAISIRLNDTQEALQKFEDFSNRMCYTLHEADRTLATTIVDLDPDRHQGDPVVMKLKEASIGIAEMLTNYSDDLYKFEQLTRLPPAHPIAPSLHVETRAYQNGERFAQSRESLCSNHSTSNGHAVQCEHISGDKRTNLSQSYAACKKSVTVAGCKCCSKRAIQHL